MSQTSRRGASPDWDADVKKRRAQAATYKKMADANAKKARASSKSGLVGMDGVDADGPQRFKYNWSRIQSARNKLSIQKEDAELRRRNKERSKYAKRIGSRMR